MPRFAILNHDHPFEHWDLLLENGDACRTWRLLVSPASQDRPIMAEELNDHRKMYLGYEGPVGNDRGTVTQWDAGTFDWVRNERDFCEVALSGHRWKGIVILRRMDARKWLVDPAD